MLKTRSRSLAALAAGTLLLLPLTGCGSSDDKKSDASAPTSASSSPTVENETAESPGAQSGSTAPTAFITKVAQAMRAKKTAHLVVEIGSSMTADADVAYRGDTTAMRMKMTSGNQNVEVIMLDDVMYLQQAAGGKFVKIDKSDPSMGSLVEQFSSFGPAASVDAMKSGVTKVVKTGSEKIDGKSYDEYTLTIDTKAISGGLGAAASKANLPKTVTYTMYVDGDDLLRRVNMQVGDQKVVMNATDWGKSVKIEAPPAAQIQSR